MNATELRNGANRSRIILALDGLTWHEARQLGAELAPYVAGGKVNDLIDQMGVEALHGLGFAINFYDAKINDISNTVTNRMMKYRDHADIVTVHTSMSADALRAAARVAEEGDFVCAGVTVLTDIDSDQCYSIFRNSPFMKVQEFTIRARSTGLQGIVCSPKETKAVRNIYRDALIINPGVRSPGEETHDQARVDTPATAVENGANLVVCGRQILGKETSAMRINEAQRINAEIDEVLEPERV